MSLSDSEIHDYLVRGYKLVNPLNLNDIQPASIDMHLGPSIRVPRTDLPEDFIVDPLKTRPSECFEDYTMIGPSSHYDLPPGGIFLGTTSEKIIIPVDLEGILDGVSSIGRWFLQVHMTAGFFDPGFEGDGVIEGRNNLPWWFRLSNGMRISQLRLTRVDGLVARPYGTANNHYQGQRGPVGSQIAGGDPWLVR